MRSELHWRTKAQPEHKASSGFSLIELLTVIAIIAILATVSMSAFTKIGQAGELTKAGSDIADILERARSHAMAYKTYVWVGFAAGEDDSLLVGVSASRNGVADPESGDLIFLDRLRSFNKVRVVSLPDSNDRPTAPPEAQIANLTSAIQTFPASPGSTVSFDRQVVQFNSRGEARIIASQPYKVSEIGLQEFVDGQERNPSNFAAIQIGGFSGAISLYRP